MLKRNHQLVPQGRAADLFASFPWRPHQLLTGSCTLLLQHFCQTWIAALFLTPPTSALSCWQWWHFLIVLICLFPFWVFSPLAAGGPFYFTYIIVSITGNIHHRHTLAVITNGFFLKTPSVWPCARTFPTWFGPGEQLRNVRKITPRKVFQLFYFNIFLFLPLMLWGYCYM